MPQKTTMGLRSDTRASLTVPNLITLVRILLTPLFIIFLIQGCYRKALIVFLLAGFSDLADGLIARLWHQRSPLGAYLDPLADKLLMSASFVTLSIAKLIPSWLTVVVISRDVLLVMGVAAFRLADYPLHIKPSLAGKLTTLLQVATVLLALVEKIWIVPPVIPNYCFWATGIVTAVSGIHYILRSLTRLGQVAPKS